MGILNVTPDSFSDGGELFRDNHLLADRILTRAVSQVEAGARIIDIGGESTRPGAPGISIQEELDRTIPVIELLEHRLEVILSIDTSKPEVMQEAVGAGAHMINDVRALHAEGAIDLAARAGTLVCLMHMQGLPDSMQENPRYDEVVLEVKAYLAGRITACLTGGMDRSQLVIDPGFGFGKTVEHNLLLLRHLKSFQDFQLPVLVGLSRKSTIGQLLNKPVDQRLYGSLAAAVLAVQSGASIVRTHDVAETVEALRICNAVMAIDLEPNDPSEGTRDEYKGE